jgi:hypothetical protein
MATFGNGGGCGGTTPDWSGGGAAVRSPRWLRSLRSGSSTARSVDHASLDLDVDRLALPTELRPRNRVALEPPYRSDSRVTLSPDAVVRRVPLPMIALESTGRADPAGQLRRLSGISAFPVARRSSGARRIFPVLAGRSPRTHQHNHAKKYHQGARHHRIASQPLQEVAHNSRAGNPICAWRPCSSHAGSRNTDDLCRQLNVALLDRRSAFPRTDTSDIAAIA